MPALPTPLPVPGPLAPLEPELIEPEPIGDEPPPMLEQPVKIMTAETIKSFFM